MAWFKVNGSTDGVDVYYLGQGTSFNVATLCPNIDYTTLTADNFVVEPVSSQSSGEAWGNVMEVGSKVIKSKFYDVQTGVLSANYQGGGWYWYRGSETYTRSRYSTSAVKAYLVIGQIKDA